MSKKSTLLNSWLELGSTPHKSGEPKDQPFKANSEIKKNLFDQYLTPGWTGDSLNSKQTLAIKRFLDLLKEESKSQFLSLQGFNKSLKLSIYNEFMEFSSKHGESHQDYGNYAEFFRQIKFSHTTNRSFLNDFIDTFCFRTAATYLLRVRFIVFLTHETGIKLNQNNVLNPLSFITTIFKKGSSFELLCDSLQKSQYSWFRPPSHLAEKVSSISNKFLGIPVTEIFKIFQEPLLEIDKLKGKKDRYSHTISHKAFGNFIDKILIHLPQWLKPKEEGLKINPWETFRENETPKNLSTKYSGENLSSFILSHWLSQEINLPNAEEFNWEYLLSPDFIGNDEDSVTFVKISNELQFLTLMVQLAKKQNHDPVLLISRIIREKENQNHNEINGQMSMFSSQEVKSENSYKRIVLNLSTLPKKNPHHYLLNRIQQEIKILHNDGFIYVFSNQNLFVPSQSDKVEQFFQKFKLEASFCFENLKGRGEIPTNLYILSKRKSEEPFPQTFESGPHKIESCLTFRWSGYLTSFQKFSDLVLELENTLKTKSPQTTPLFQKQVSENLSFEFHQDAILEGKLLHSHNQDPNKITHPNFFRNLAKSCFSFDQFFTVENINGESANSPKSEFTSSLLGLNFKKTEDFPYVVLIDFRNQANINIEVISGDSYKAEMEKYGTAFFQYFGIIPKRRDININAFREYFNSELGHQIVQLSLNGGFTKVKSKLRALLIPKFFLEKPEVPISLMEDLSFLKTSPKVILETHPHNLQELLTDKGRSLDKWSKSHPHHTLCLLSFFKQNIESCLKKSLFKETESINYNNPIILDPLLKLELHSLTNNKEVFIDFKSRNLNTPLTKIAHKRNEEGDHYLALESNQQIILEFYSSKELTSFIKFLLSPFSDHSILSIIQNLQVPTNDQLRQVISNFESMKNALELTYRESQLRISKILFHQISSSSIG